MPTGKNFNLPHTIHHDKEIRHAFVNLFSLRGAVLEEALRTGYITYSDDDLRRVLGAMLTV